MRIAFTSCMFNRICPDQPVWDWIGDREGVDQLVLLGDQLYLDLENGGNHPQGMSDDAFGQHLFARYRELIAQPQFSRLVQALPAGAVNCIWDDHDFLWDDALGAEVTAVHGGKIRLSTAFHEAFRRALAARLAAGSFPDTYRAAVFWDLAQPPLATPTLQLPENVALHLTDGRTHRTRTAFLQQSKRTIFGAAQLDAFGARLRARPDAVHLWASGSTIAGYQRYENDLAWLKEQAADRRVLVLSGDIHRNQLDTFATGGFALHEATASGAGVLDAVVFGDPRRNYGLLDIDAQAVTISLYRDNQLEHQRVLNRQSWS